MTAAASVPLTPALDSWLRQPLVERLTELGVALLILLMGWWLARRLAGLLDRAMKRIGVDDILRAFLRNVAQVLMLLVVVIAALQKTGLVPVTSLIAVLGAAGLAIALALKDSLANIASGVMLIALRPFRAGDSVQAGGKEGVIEQVRIFHTRMRTFTNEEIVLPNSEITSKPIVNLTGRPIRRIDIPVGIDHGGNIAHAREVLLHIAAQAPGVLEHPTPEVLVTGLGESSVNLLLRAWVKTPELAVVRSALLEAIHDDFASAGLTIPCTRQDLHELHRDGTSPPL
ncbi:MAG: mechanosensitive ion channel family protein [Pseudoxanthomonas suwonensis]|nr:mechanosensitive ion channel family protein [Pseudoxanthomonas suwonensis]